MRLSRLLLFLFIPLFGLAQRSQPTLNIRTCDTLIMQGHYARAARCLQPHYNANPQGPSYEKLLDAYLLSNDTCLLYTSPSPRDLSTSRMPSSA